MPTVSRDWPLWSTTARLVVDDPDELDNALAIADEVLGEIDAACSRFRYDSELNRVAARLPGGVDVSRTLAMLVARALVAAASTDGSVDPTIGYVLGGIGYDRDIALILDDDRPVRAKVSPRPGWRSVRLIDRHLTVPAHLALDLGATAKALAADTVAARVHQDLGCAVLVSLGGDIATGGHEPEDGWIVRVQDLPADPAAEVRLDAGWGLATSSTQKRRWTRGGETMHHIIDPATGLPADPVWRSVSVAAPSCFAANTLSTAAIVRGASAPEWLARRASARLVDADGRVITVGGWPEDAELELVAVGHDGGVS